MLIAHTVTTFIFRCASTRYTAESSHIVESLVETDLCTYCVVCQVVHLVVYVYVYDFC